MFKVVLVLIVPVIIAVGLIYLFILRDSATLPNLSDKGESDSLTAFSATSSTDSASETSLALPTPKDSSVSERVKTLEASVDILNKKVDALTLNLSRIAGPSASPVTTPNPTTTTTSSNTAKSIYIPIGFGGSSTATSDFESIGSQEVTIDSGNYSGYKQAVLEVNFRIKDSNGTGEARLFNATDGTALLGSVVSTTSSTFATKSSGAFNLSSGSKKYTLQLKSTTGYSVDVQLARIRIDY
jgi:hypothetical protein